MYLSLLAEDKATSVQAVLGSAAPPPAITISIPTLESLSLASECLDQSATVGGPVIVLAGPTIVTVRVFEQCEWFACWIIRCSRTLQPACGVQLCLTNEGRVWLHPMLADKDMGATAYTSHQLLQPLPGVTVRGLPINTDVPTPSGQAQIVTYSATDPATGKTSTARRWVVVVDPCPLPQRRCRDTLQCSDTSGSCTATSGQFFGPPAYDTTPPQVRGGTWKGS